MEARWTQVAVATGVAVILAVACSLPAASLETADGLRLELSGTGMVTAAVTGGRPWKIVGGTGSGLMLRDVAAGGDFVPAGGSAIERDDAVVHSGTHAGLQLDFQVTYRAAANAVNVAGFVHDLSGKDRAVTVRLALPVDAAGGIWWPDINTREPIAGAVYGNLRHVGVGAGGQASRYTWAAISTAAGELCLGIPLDHFVVHRIAYSAPDSCFYVEFDFGLAAETERFPFRADFHAVIYTAAPEWGFRSATAKYYTLYPNAFERRARKEGLWMPFTSPEKVEDYEDFNFAFHEGSNNMGFDEAHGIYSFPYVSPHWGMLWMPDVKDRPSREFVEARIEELLADKEAKYHKQAQIIRSCGATDAEGRLQLKIGRAHWAPSEHGAVGWFAMSPANADPDLEALGQGETTGGKTQRSIKRIVEDNAEKGVFVDGIYFDGVDERPCANYSREQFKFADVPLTFGSDSRRPVLCGPFCSYKFLKWTAEYLWPTGRMTMANGVPSQFPFSVHYLDVAGREIEPSIERDPVSVSLLSFARTLQYHKPYVLLYKPRLEERFDRDLSPYLIDYMNTCMLYAAEPSLFKLFSNSNEEFYHSFFERPDWVNAYRPLFIEYLPLIQELASAGWEPVTGARSSDGSVLVERFGAGNTLCLVAYNPRPVGSGVPVTISVDRAEVGWQAAALPSAADLASCAAVPVTGTGRGWEVTLEVPPRRAAMLVFRETAEAVASLDFGEAKRYAEIARNRVLAKMQQVSPIDFESDPDGDGTPAGFSKYQEGSVEYASDKETCRSVPRSTRIVLHGKARGTQSASLPVTAGRTYSLGVWVKTAFPTPGNAHVYVQWRTKTNKLIKMEPPGPPVTETTDWANITQEHIAPERAAQMHLVLVATRRGQGDATVWFDDPRVVEMTDADTKTVILPLPKPSLPQSAEETAQELLRHQHAIDRLAPSAASGVDRGHLIRGVLSRAGLTDEWAGQLVAADPRYANVAAALQTCAMRLRRAARLLIGWRVTMVGPDRVAQGESPRYEVDLQGGAVPVEQLEINVTAPHGWSTIIDSTVPGDLAIGGHAQFGVTLAAQDGAAGGGTVTLTVNGRTPGKAVVKLCRTATFGIVPACESSLRLTGKTAGGRQRDLEVVLSTARLRTPLATEVAAVSQSGIQASPARQAVSVAPGQAMRVPISLVADTDAQIGWRNVTVQVAWDGGNVNHDHGFLYVPPGHDLLRNGTMEQPAVGGQCTSWQSYADGGYAVDRSVTHDGDAAIRAVNDDAVRQAGARQTIILDQKQAKPLVVSGWSLYRPSGKNADDLMTIGMTENAAASDSGNRTRDYAIYVDLHYVDGGALYGQTAMFDTSRVGWQFSETVIHAPRPVRDATVYLLFRGQDGTAWFDGVSLVEGPPNLALLADAQVSADSSYGGYMPAAIIDGVVDVTGVPWDEAAWASAETGAEHWVQIHLPSPTTIQSVVIHWAIDQGKTWTSRNYAVQVETGHSWLTVASVNGQTSKDMSVHTFASLEAKRIRILQAPGGGHAERPMLMWIREVGVY